MPGRRERGSGGLTWDERRQAWRCRVALPGGGERTHYVRAADWGGKRKAESEAKRWLKEQVTAQDNGRDLKGARQTLKVAIAKYLADCAHLAPTTLTNYRMMGRHIVQALGSQRVDAVTAEDVRAMDRAHREAYTGRYADSILQLLNTVYERLIALEIVTRNPVRAYRKIVAPGARRGQPMREGQPVDPARVRMLLQALADSPVLAYTTWLAVTGCRGSELRGLRWANVDAQALTVTFVEQRRGRDRHTPAALKTDKSGVKARTIPIPRALLDATPAGDDLVLPHTDGSGLPYKTFHDAFRTAATKAKLPPGFRPHDLRHTVGAGLLALGCPVELRAALLGHTRRGMTEHYSRPDADMLRPWVEAWAALLLPGAAGAGRREG